MAAAREMYQDGRQGHFAHFLLHLFWLRHVPQPTSRRGFDSFAVGHVSRGHVFIGEGCNEMLPEVRRPNAVAMANMEST